MIGIEEKAARMEITEEGIKRFAGRIIKEMNPTTDVNELAGLALHQRAELCGEVAVTWSDPFLAATALQEGTA